jgi:hypothetical protein
VPEGAVVAQTQTQEQEVQEVVVQGHQVGEEMVALGQ